MKAAALPEAQDSPELSQKPERHAPRTLETSPEMMVKENWTDHGASPSSTAGSTALQKHARQAQESFRLSHLASPIGQTIEMSNAKQLSRPPNAPWRLQGYMLSLREGGTDIVTLQFLLNFPDRVCHELRQGATAYRVMEDEYGDRGDKLYLLAMAKLVAYNLAFQFQQNLLSDSDDDNDCGSQVQ
ncbi:hypothetical protein BS50DRAFT_628297 [Corynespora cassiicola Philippines]|uniref:Uncharacterized protein n=1 Tax=Corynespora cassiicola Philippines TaxID=1448308 RepID=A0A2T2PCF7_CORCC|nr:hypothetical protein BS50DRAFT_628297 [Corynespora cassiicola Philippines]